MAEMTDELAQQYKNWCKLMETRVTSAFRRWGRSANGVARYFEKHGVTGIPDCGFACPISEALRALGVPEPVVGPTKMWYGSRYHPIELPYHIRVFNRKFDEGRYPALVSGAVPGF